MSDTASGEQPDVTVATAIAYVCEQLPELRERLDRTGNALLDRLLTAIRDGDTGLRGLLDELHETLQFNGDALGVYGNVRGGLRHGSEDFGPSQPAEVVFLCPGQRCLRSWAPDPDTRRTEPPRCLVDATPLRWERL